MRKSIFEIGFTAKSGDWIEPRPHTAKFIGKRNATKGKVLIILAHVPGRCLTARQLADRTGTNYAYLKSRLSFWVDWKYIERKLSIGKNERPCYAYRIAKRGLNFVNSRIPIETRNKYVTELNAWLKEHPAT